MFFSYSKIAENEILAFLAFKDCKHKILLFLFMKTFIHPPKYRIWESFLYIRKLKIGGSIRISINPTESIDRISMYPKKISIDPLGLKRPLIEALVTTLLPSAFHWRSYSVFFLFLCRSGNDKDRYRT